MQIFGLLVAAAVSASSAAPLTLVDLRDTSTSPLPIKIAAQVCVGLANRNPATHGGAYALLDARDTKWLTNLGISAPSSPTPAPAFISHCIAQGAAKGYIRYNLTQQQLIIPNIITLAAVLDAVPLEDGHPDTGTAPLVFDAVKELAGFSALQATQWVFDRYINQTSTMCKLNPGLETSKHPFHPNTTGLPDPSLFDFVVKQKLFTFFLEEGCIPGTKEHALVEKIVTNNPWPRPIVVYGYDNSFDVAGGDLFEAETTCVKEHNLGQSASQHSTNLAFFSSSKRISAPLLQNPDPPVVFNKSKTYLNFIVGDGDNVDYVKGARMDWMLDRVARCQKDPSYHGCFPLDWTISPQLLHLAPQILNWYYNQTYLTKQDYFVLPPSGDTYSYPAEMTGSDLSNFVSNTERDCTLLNTTGTVDWEWFTQWHNAIQHYYPRYTARGVVKGFFAVNVPFMLPVLAFGKNEFYKVFSPTSEGGGKVVLFRPREWRGTVKENVPFAHKESLTVAEMAAEINSYPRGTVTSIYLTSDGGGKLDDIYKLVPLLHEHVQVVNHNQVADFAVQAHAQ